MGLLGGSGDCVEVADGWMVDLGCSIVDGRGKGGGGSFVGETAHAGVMGSGVVDLRGVLRGDLKGWDRVFAEVFRRRRLKGWMGDIFEMKIRSKKLSDVFRDSGGIGSIGRYWCGD